MGVLRVKIGTTWKRDKGRGNGNNVINYGFAKFTTLLSSKYSDRSSHILYYNYPSPPDNDLYYNYNGTVDIKYYFKVEGGLYYAKYSVGTELFPSDGAWQLVSLDNVINIVVYSYVRIDETDLTKGNFIISNTTGKEINIAVVGDDDGNPAFVLGSYTGTVNVTNYEYSEYD